jgi:hypothetical protein
MRVRQIKFLSTVEADLICALFNGEGAAEVTVPAAKDELENRRQFHKFRRRRSQIPLASSHSREERTPIRAQAIEQPAAPKQKLRADSAVFGSDIYSCPARAVLKNLVFDRSQPFRQLVRAAVRACDGHFEVIWQCLRP